MHSTLPIERLRVVSRFEDVRLTEIRRGVVFVLAIAPLSRVSETQAPVLKAEASS